MNEQIDLLREIRDLLRVIAEPALAKLDEKLRTTPSECRWKSKLAARAVLLMDGGRSQAAICKEAAIDKGALSKLVKITARAGTVGQRRQTPKLVIAVPPIFFDKRETEMEDQSQLLNAVNEIRDLMRPHGGARNRSARQEVPGIS